MMPQPENEIYQALLSDYMTETKDNGFTDQILSAKGLQSQRHNLYRRLSLLSAGLIGGIIAAINLGPFLDIVSHIAWPENPLPTPIWMIAGIILMMFAAFSTLDDQSGYI